MSFGAGMSAPMLINRSCPIFSSSVMRRMRLSMKACLADAEGMATAGLPLPAPSVAAKAEAALRQARLAATASAENILMG